MIILIDRSNSISIFENETDAENCLETIDIIEGEYEFMDEYGQIYKTDIISTPKFFSTGSFKLIFTGKYDKEKLLSIIERAKEIFPVTKKFKNLKELKEYISKTIDITK